MGNHHEIAEEYLRAYENGISSWQISEFEKILDCVKERCEEVLFEETNINMERAIA